MTLPPMLFIDFDLTKVDLMCFDNVTNKQSATDFQKRLIDRFFNGRAITKGDNNMKGVY